MRPLTPPDCDLRDFPRMMIDIPRLRGSDFDSTPRDDVWRAGVNLWLTSWHQVPAASLVNNEAFLAKAAGLGRDVKQWRKIRTEVLTAWRLADDGRLYHATVAEMVLEAWLEKLAQRLYSQAGNAKRWKTAFDPAPLNAAIRSAEALLTDLNPASKALPKSRRRNQPCDPLGAPGGDREASGGISGGMLSVIGGDLAWESIETGTGTEEKERSSQEHSVLSEPDSVAARSRLANGGIQ